jgi:hypothetical protein
MGKGKQVKARFPILVGKATARRDKPYGLARYSVVCFGRDSLHHRRRQERDQAVPCAQRLLRIHWKLNNDEIFMKLNNIPFITTDWSLIEQSKHPGVQGEATWRTQHFNDIRVRMVEYTPGYLADHWCSKGHVLLCLSGELHTELADGRRFVLKPGMSYQVADNAEAHRSSTDVGATLFIVD